MRGHRWLTEKIRAADGGEEIETRGARIRKARLGRTTIVIVQPRTARFTSAVTVAGYDGERQVTFFAWDLDDVAASLKTYSDAVDAAAAAVSEEAADDLGSLSGITLLPYDFSEVTLDNVRSLAGEALVVALEISLRDGIAALDRRCATVWLSRERRIDPGVRKSIARLLRGVALRDPRNVAIIDLKDLDVERDFPLGLPIRQEYAGPSTGAVFVGTFRADLGDVADRMGEILSLAAAAYQRGDGTVDVAVGDVYRWISWLRVRDNVLEGVEFLPAGEVDALLAELAEIGAAIPVDAAPAMTARGWRLIRSSHSANLYSRDELQACVEHSRAVTMIWDSQESLMSAVAVLAGRRFIGNLLPWQVSPDPSSFRFKRVRSAEDPLAATSPAIMASGYSVPREALDAVADTLTVWGVVEVD